MRFCVSFILLIATNLNLYAQLYTYSGFNYNGIEYDVFQIKIDTSILKKFEIVENKIHLPHKDFITSLNADSSVFVINASIVDKQCQPLGFYTTNSIEIKPPNLDDGQGNFYLKPNGAFVVTGTDAIICESSQIEKVKDIRLGIQSGPMMLTDGEVNNKFNITSQNNAVRCGVGISEINNEKILFFCLSKSPVNFYNFTMLFKEKFNCSNALCLESGACVINLPYLTCQSAKNTTTICNYIYYKD